MTTEFDKKIQNSLLLFKIKEHTPQYVIGSCNKQIVEYFGIYFNQRLLNSFDELHKKNNTQFYNLLTEKIESVPEANIEEVILLGVPLSFLPGWLFSDVLTSAGKKESFDAYFENMKPLMDKIKDFKKLKINDFGLTRASPAVHNLNEKIKNLNIIIPENNIHGFVTFISYSANLSEVFIDAYKALDYLPCVQNIFKDMNRNLNATTFDEFCNKLNDDSFLNELKNIYIEFLTKHKNILLEKYNNDLNELNLQNKQVQSLVSEIDLKLQLNRQINNLENLNFSDELEGILSPYIIYKYWPFDTLPPEELLINLPAFTRKDLNFYKILLKNYSPDEATNILVNPIFYFEEIKNLRIKQIKDHRDKFISEIDNDILNTEDQEEKNDLEQIKLLLSNDAELFANDILTKTSVTELLEYWPVMLYPAPNFVLTYNA